MSYLYKSGAEIAAKRREAIQSGAKPIANGHCHFCGWGISKGNLWCCKACCDDYACEIKSLLPDAHT